MKQSCILSIKENLTRKLTNERDYLENVYTI